MLRIAGINSLAITEITGQRTQPISTVMTPAKDGRTTSISANSSAVRVAKCRPPDSLQHYGRDDSLESLSTGVSW